MPEKEMTREEFLDYTIRTFQPKSKRILTLEDAREITQNMVGFFRTLQDLHKSAGKNSPQK
jgi:hypothetical protein